MRLRLRRFVGVSIVLGCILATSGARAQSRQQFADLGDRPLVSGQVLKNCRVGYRTHGALNAERSNAVLVPSWFGGAASNWDDMVGPGKLIDATGLFVVVVDALGNGVSSSPSNSKDQPRDTFPAIAIRDMVESQRRLVVDVLKIQKLHAVVGMSMGGMQTFQWIVSHPAMMDRAVSIVGTPKQTSQDLLLWKSMLRTIADHRGSPEDVKRGMRAVSRMSTLHLWTAPYHVAHTKTEDVDAMMTDQDKSADSIDAENFASQLQAMIGHDIFAGFGGSEEAAARAITAKLLVIAVTTDVMVNSTPALRLADTLKAQTLVLTNDGGHLGVLIDQDRVTSQMKAFLGR